MFQLFITEVDLTINDRYRQHVTWDQRYFVQKKHVQDNENVLTHYQRAFKKNILITRFGPVESSNANIFLCREGKRYMSWYLYG